MNGTMTRPERPGDPLLCSGCQHIYQRAVMAVDQEGEHICPDCMEGAGEYWQLKSKIEEERDGLKEKYDDLRNRVDAVAVTNEKLRQLLVPFAKLARAVHPGSAVEVGLYPSIVGESSPAKVSDCLAALEAVKELVPATVPPLRRKGGAA